MLKYEFFNVYISKTVRAIEKCSYVTFIQVDMWHRMEPLRILYSVTVTYVLKIKLFKWLFRQVQAEKYNIYIFIRKDVRYLPTNDIIANVVHQDLNLHFEGHKFRNVSTLKAVRSSENALESKCLIFAKELNHCEFCIPRH